jgi:hypothetical protein
VWIEDLDATVKRLNVGKHTKFNAGETPLVDRRIYDRNTNKAGFVSLAASGPDSAPTHYLAKFQDLLRKPFDDTSKSTKLLLEFFGYQGEAGAFVDRSSLWVPAGEQARARQVVLDAITDKKPGRYKFTRFAEYVDHLRRTRPDLKDDGAIAKALLDKIEEFAAP